MNAHLSFLLTPLFFSLLSLRLRLFSLSLCCISADCSFSLRPSCGDVTRSCGQLGLPFCRLGLGLWLLLAVDHLLLRYRLVIFTFNCCKDTNTTVRS